MTDEENAVKLQLMQFFIGLAASFGDYTTQQRQELLEWFMFLPDLAQRRAKLNEHVDRLERWHRTITA